MAFFIPFNDWVILHCIYVPHLFPFLCWWTFRLLPCLGYCKQCKIYLASRSENAVTCNQTSYLYISQKKPISVALTSILHFVYSLQSGFCPLIHWKVQMSFKNLTQLDQSQILMPLLQLASPALHLRSTVFSLSYSLNSSLIFTLFIQITFCYSKSTVNQIFWTLSVWTAHSHFLGSIVYDLSPRLLQRFLKMSSCLSFSQSMAHVVTWVIFF